MNIFHACLKFILRPLEKAGVEGELIKSGDGLVCHCFPILATYIVDYPKQVLVTLVKTGECPVCDISWANMGDINNTRRPRDINPVLDALNKIGSGVQTFVNACKDIGIKAIPIPFWQDLPFVNIYSSITPNILHQLYQGVIKHLISWLIALCGHTEINARSRCLSINHYIHHFMKGISGLLCVTGTEHNRICRFLLGIVHDI